jgi:hypothetical protein
MNIRKTVRLTVLLGAALLGVACIAETAGPGNTPQVIVVTATPEGAAQNPAQESPLSPTEEPAQLTTDALTPTITATYTAAPVTMTAGQELSCVTGPDWRLYEWVTKIPKDATVTLIARAVPEIPDYYVARTGDGKECWAFGGSSVVSGPVATLPVRETPPLPTVSFVVRNRVHIPLTTVYIRSAGDSSWGGNRIASPLADMSGETSISITAGYYDVRVLDVLGNVMYESYNRAIGADDAYRILTVDPDVNFTIRNDFSFSICWIDVMVMGDPWQKLYATEDGGGSILTGQTRDFTLRAGRYSVRLTRCTSVVVGVAILAFYPGMPAIVFG